MAIAESEVRAFITKACALVDGKPLDYVSLMVPNARNARSWGSHAKVNVGESKTPNEVADEIWSHVDDIVSSAADEGRSEAIIRILLYRDGASAGSRTFRTEVAPNHTGDEESGPTNAGQEMALFLREARLANRDLLDAVKVSSTKGWEIANRLIEENSKLKQENMEGILLLELQKQDNGSNIVNELAGKLIPKVVEEFIGYQKLKALQSMSANHKPEIGETKENGNE